MNKETYENQQITSQDWIDIYASRQSQKILTGTLGAIELHHWEKLQKTNECAVIFYGDVKVLIPINEMNIAREERTIIRSMIGAEIDFVVFGIDSENGLAVASRKVAMHLRKTLELGKHKVGDIINVRVTSIGKNWVYVDAYGIETTIEKNEIAYGYIDDLSKLCEIGDKMPAMIKELDIENNKITLSVKDTRTDPFDGIENKYRIDGEYATVITGIKNFGIFVELENGIYALCNHPSWIGYNPTIGDKMLVKITRIKQQDRKIDGRLIRLIKKAR